MNHMSSRFPVEWCGCDWSPAHRRVVSTAISSVCEQYRSDKAVVQHVLIQFLRTQDSRRKTTEYMIVQMSRHKPVLGTRVE
jgi:hypothetical protein